MWTAIITAVLKVFGDIITNIFTNEQKVQAELKAKTYEEKMNSYVRSEAAEKAIEKSKPTEAVKTPSAWNAGVGRPLPVLFLLLSILTLSGCVRYVYVNDRKPVIEIPERSVLETEPAFTDRELKLVDYAQNLESRIGTYNEWAKAENVRNGYAKAEEGKSKPEEKPDAKEAPKDSAGEDPH